MTWEREIEEGNLTGFMPAHLVIGRGKIDGRPVVVTSDT